MLFRGDFFFPLSSSAQDNLESDSFQIECLKDGTWSNKIPICKSKETLPHPMHMLFLLKLHAEWSCPARAELLTQFQPERLRNCKALLANTMGLGPNATSRRFVLSLRLLIS